MNRLALIIIFLAVTSLQAAKPNFLVIVTDDQRPDTIAALGNPRIATPNLNWLVKNGMVFENFICSNPLCVPSRAEILTGRTGFQNGVLGMGREKINPKLTLWPAAMAARRIGLSFAASTAEPGKGGPGCMSMTRTGDKSRSSR